MERAKLEGYGLTKEQIDEIMADHGRAVNAAKEGVTALQQTIAEQTAQIQRCANYDDILRERDELRTSSSADQTELVQLREFKKSRVYGDRMATAVGGKQFVNDVTKDHVFNAFVAEAEKPENNGKTDTEILQTVVGGHEEEYFKSKFGVRMTPTHTGKTLDDVRAVQEAKYKDNPYYKP
jgi:hypothetical protein